MPHCTRYTLYATVCLGLIVFSNIDCQKPSLTYSEIITPKWQDGDKYYYGIYRGDVLIGNMQRTLHFDMEVNEPVYIIEILTEMTLGKDYIIDSSVVCFSRTNLIPRWSYRKIETDFDYHIIETHYSDSDVEIWQETMDGKKSVDLQVKGIYFDNEMIFSLIRALRFDKKKNYSFYVVTPFLSQLTYGIFKYNGRATIATPAGTFDCDKITYNTESGKYNLFIEHNEPMRLIRYQQKNSDIAVVLLK